MTTDVQDAAQAAGAPFNHFYQDGPPEGEYRFFQIAWIVDDLFEAARRWTRTYGVGPFLVLPIMVLMQSLLLRLRSRCCRLR